MATSLDNYYISVYGPTGLNILTHYYPLSESVGAGTAIDLVGGQNGTNSLITAGVADIVPTSDGSTCYTFVATSFVNLINPFALGTGGQFGFECWFKFTTVATDFQAFYQNGVNTHGNNGWLNGTALSLSSDNDTTTTSGFTASTGAAHHLVMGYNGTNRLIYIDGVLRATQVKAAGTAPTTTNYIGRWNNTGSGGSFLGQLQKVCYYNLMLTQAQVTANFNAGNTGPPPVGGPFEASMGGNMGAHITGGYQG